MFGRWIGPEGDVALPLYQGAMVHHFTPSFQQLISGAGRVNQWMPSPADNIQFRPKFLIAETTVTEIAPQATQLRFAFRDVARNTDERTLIGSVIPGFPCGNTLPVLRLQTENVERLLMLGATTSSLTCDYVARLRLTGAHMNYFVLQDIPIPLKNAEKKLHHRLVYAAARLTLLHRRFAPDWLKGSDKTVEN
jgi:hypothetical protein